MAGRSNVYSNLLMRDLRFLQITTLVGETKQNVNLTLVVRVVLLFPHSQVHLFTTSFLEAG